MGNNQKKVKKSESQFQTELPYTFTMSPDETYIE